MRSTSIFFKLYFNYSTKPSEKDTEAEADFDMVDLCFENSTDSFEGLIMTLCAARNQPDYIHFMSTYQVRYFVERQQNNFSKLKLLDNNFF